MKRLFAIFVSLIPLFYTLNVFAAPCQDQKTYVTPEQLNINSKGIFLNLDNQWIETNALFSDENGIYIRSLSPQEMGCRKNYFPCRNCDRCVHAKYEICPHCEKPT